ncbi:MAG: flippase-like domain-containing protein [Kiritimatiellae bacterium]|nr:flippase-like domain-containing protein [Kiritimatiellia bacterium]
MKRTRKLIGVLIRLAVGLAIVAYLGYKIDRGTVRVDFDVARASVSEGSVYADVAKPARQFLVMEPIENGTRLRTLQMSTAETPPGSAGTLGLERGTGPRRLAWHAANARQSGLRTVGTLFRRHLRRWPMWVGGVLFIFVAFLCAIVRWGLLLDVQGLNLPWRRVFCIFYIGHFFNSFMLGATGGDLAKAYYVAGQTRRKKTEAVSTVFIDRAVGLVALLSLSLAMMAVRYRFFLERPALHLPALTVLIVSLGAAAGLVVVFGRNVFERWGVFRALAARTAFGPILKRAYDAFFLCRTRPRVLALCYLLSLGVHTLVILSCVWFGRSLGIELAVSDYLALFPIINALAAVPITPGGLGVREGLAVRMLGAVGVPSIQALPLSLMLYLGILLLSLFGGVIFMCHSAASGRTLRDAMAQLEEE